MNDGKNETDNRYFVGSNLGDLIFEITQILIEVGENEKPPNNKVKIVPLHPKPFKLWWEFYNGDVKICTIRYEAQDTGGTTNLCWLEWHNDYNGSGLEELYISSIGFPEWVETDEDEELFFKGN